MKRAEFRAYFDRHPGDGHVSFDRRGFADVGLPWPGLKDAKELAQYEKVKRLSLGIHTGKFPAESLITMLTAWKGCLEDLKIQDFRFDVSRSDRCRVLPKCVRLLASMEKVRWLEIVEIPVPKSVATAISLMPQLTSLRLRGLEFSLSGFKELENSASLEDVYICDTSGIYKEDTKELSKSFRDRCRVVVFK